MQAFEIEIAVGPGDIDELGHVNNVTYVRWIQDVAVAHWRAVALPEDQEQLLWIVLRHEIDYKLPAFLGDRLAARTWVGKASRLKFERYTEITRLPGGETLAQARTLWCPIDRQTGKPSPAGDSVRGRFATGA